MTTLTIPALPPRLAQRYQVGPVLGRGIGSTVFRVHDTLLHRDAAVKTFPVAPESSPSAAWCLLAPADHPALVPVYDVEERDDRAFVVMALLEGGSLATRLAEEHPGSAGGLALGESLRTAATVADALDQLHHAGAAHRAVTPTNVVYDTEDRVRLADVGVADLAATPRLGDTGLPVTSAAYVAPEQVRGAPAGAEADLYALGLVLIEALTGRRAFPGDPESSARARLERAPTVPDGLPAAVAALVSAMTTDDPAQRPDAAEAAAALRRALIEAQPALTLGTGGGLAPGGAAVTGCRLRARSAAASPRRAPTVHQGPGIVGGTVTVRRRGRRLLAGVAASAVVASVAALAETGALAGLFADFGSPAAVASGGATLGVPDPSSDPPAAPGLLDPSTPGSSRPLGGGSASASAAEALRASGTHPAKPTHQAAVPAEQTSPPASTRTGATAPNHHPTPDHRTPAGVNPRRALLGDPDAQDIDLHRHAPRSHVKAAPASTDQNGPDQTSTGEGGSATPQARSPEVRGHHQLG